MALVPRSLYRNCQRMPRFPQGRRRRAPTNYEQSHHLLIAGNRPSLHFPSMCHRLEANQGHPRQCPGYHLEEQLDRRRFRLIETFSRSYPLLSITTVSDKLSDLFILQAQITPTPHLISAAFLYTSHFTVFVVEQQIYSAFSFV
jgi:hypothetical protein